MLSRVILLITITFVLNSCTSTTIRDREYLSIVGKVVINSELPKNALLHVLLTENSQAEVEDKVIATDSTVLIGNIGNQPFSIPYRSDIIKKESNYLLLACITVEDKVIHTSNHDAQVLTHGYSNTAVIQLKQQLNSLSESKTKNLGHGDTLLQRGVQSNLADVCRQKSPGYDHVTRSKASKILPDNLLKGTLHQVREKVEIHGPHYFFIIDSQYGQFSAQGISMLKKVIREIYAIESLMKVTRSDAYLNAAGDSFVTPFKEVKELIMNPIDTLSGIPKGAIKVVKTTVNSLTTGRSQYEDNYAEAFITVSKYKRRHANSLGVDVYSSNPLLQRELDRLGWVEAFGNWTPSVVLLPLSGPGHMAYSAFSWTETLNRVLVEQSPDFLRDQNDRELKGLGVPLRLRQKLLGHTYFSPRHATIMVKAFVELTGVDGIILFVQEAVKAESEIDALTFQRIAELLAAYHKNQQKIVKILIHKGLLLGYTQDDVLLVTFPLDYLRWTPFIANMLEDIDLVEEGQVKKKVAWVTGSFSPIAKDNLKKLEFEISEQVENENEIEMMD